MYPNAQNIIPQTQQRQKYLCFSSMCVFGLCVAWHDWRWKKYPIASKIFLVPRAKSRNLLLIYWLIFVGVLVVSWWCGTHLLIFFRLRTKAFSRWDTTSKAASAFVRLFTSTNSIHLLSRWFARVDCRFVKVRGVSIQPRNFVAWKERPLLLTSEHPTIGCKVLSKHSRGEIAAPWYNKNQCHSDSFLNMHYESREMHKRTTQVTVIPITRQSIAVREIAENNDGGSPK